MSVWALAEIHAGSMVLELGDELRIRRATVAGYAAAKLAAWLDRSAWGEVKDANDLALAVHWYAEWPAVEERLYTTVEGQRILLAEEVDVPRAAARMLGEDVAVLVGSERLDELRDRWPGDVELLTRNFVLGAGQVRPDDPRRRRELIDALTRGLMARS